MKETIVDSFASIEILLQKKEFQEALTTLEQIDNNSLTEEDYAFYCILLTEIHLWLGNADIERPINIAVKHFKYGHDNLKFARAKYLQGWMQTSLGLYPEAHETLLESYASYKRCDDYEGQARVLNRLAFIANHTGDINSAILYLSKAIAIYGQLRQDGRVFGLTANLATTYYLSGLLDKASELFRNLESHAKNQSVDHQFQYFLRYAITTGLKGSVLKALELMQVANQFRGQFHREEAQYYEYLGWIHILAGDFKEAEKALLSGLELSLKIAPESALISQTKRLLADAYLGLKKFDQAQKYAEEALIVAEKINERAEIAACWRVFAQTSLQKGEKDKAKEWFKKAIDLFAQISSRYELAATRYLAAVTELYGNGEKAAFLYLAKEYFESEDIRPYIEKVKAVLTVTPARPAPRPSGGACPVFVAEHPTTRKIRALAENIAASEMTVLLTGPTGTGKDQLAKYIHYCSGRAGKFVSVNAAAIPEGMVESELFGYRKGAFTGAPQDKPGLFETAEGGTFYLNEIADTTPQFQAKLLEVLESREVRRLGSTQPTKLNIRVIAATNQNLEEAIRSVRFRADLYHRLNEIPISLPPLSERSDDIPALISHFLAEGGFDPKSDGNHDALKEICSILQTRPWSGNVRELRVEVRRLCLTCSGDISRMLEFLSEGNQTDRERLITTLQESDGNQREAARRLGLTEGGVRYQMRKYDIGNDSGA